MQRDPTENLPPLFDGSDGFVVVLGRVAPRHEPEVERRRYWRPLWASVRYGLRVAWLTLKAGPPL